MRIVPSRDPRALFFVISSDPFKTLHIAQAFLDASLQHNECQELELCKQSAFVAHHISKTKDENLIIEKPTICFIHFEDK